MQDYECYPQHGVLASEIQHKGQEHSQQLGQVVASEQLQIQKNGSRCRFNVKQLFYVQDIAEFVYYNTKHANKDGLIVHGKVRQGDRACYATQISA
jgi:hypothetical protein